MQGSMIMTNETHAHYSYPLVAWGSTLMGAAVAIVIAVMLNMLGAALGFATAAIGKTAEASAAAGIMGLVWMVASNFTALGYGAWLAARSAHNADHHSGTLQGIGVWAVTSLVVLFLAGSAISGAASTAMVSAGAASSQTVADHADNRTAADVAQQAANDAQAKIDQNQQQIKDAAVKTAGVTSAAAFGTFLAMALGLLAAILGAREGAKHPQWENRPRVTYGRNDQVTR